jgi:formate-dependent nitrite reductase membrane component NrfD
MIGKDPAWTWYIVWYFFIGGLAAGAYFMAALADLFGKERHRSVARAGYAVALPLVAVCPLLLTLDLGVPARTFYMFRAFRPGSPMSIGSWALLGFGVFALVSLLLVLGEQRAARDRAAQLGQVRRIVAVPGMLLGFFVASYTGVLLGATSRPVWAGNIWIGPLFIASAASIGIAAIALWPARAALPHFRRLERFTAGFEALLLVLFLQALGAGAALFLVGSLAPVFWGAVVVAGLALPFALHAVAGGQRRVEMTTAVLVLVGGFALRYVVLVSGQM